MDFPPRQKSGDASARDGLMAWPCVETMDRVLAPGGVEADYNWKMKASVKTMADVSPQCESDRAAIMRNVELRELDANTTPTQRHCPTPPDHAPERQGNDSIRNDMRSTTDKAKCTYIHIHTPT